MNGVTVRVTSSDFRERIARLKRPGKVLARALNRSIDSGKTAAIREVAADMGLKSSDVRELVKVKKATAENLTATIYASARRVPLIKFGARGKEPSRGKGPGVRAKLKGGAGTYPNAFIATVGNGHRGVFQRKAGAGRLPMRELYGPSVYQAFQKHQAAAAARALEQLEKNVAHEIEFALTRK